MPKSLITNDFDIDIELEDYEEFDVEVLHEEELPYGILPEQGLVFNPQFKDPLYDIDVTNIQFCPRCGKPLRPALAIGGGESETWKECPEDGTLINTYMPTPYQAEFLKRPERYKMSAGGFGSGKTTTNVEDTIKHLVLIPGSRVIVTGRSYPSIEGTFIKEFNVRMPAKLVRRKNEQKHELQLTNGSELLYRSFDDPTKMKSLNASKIIIVEASDTPAQGFTMMQSRLRNKAALIPYYDAENKPLMVWDDIRKTMRVKYRIDARSINLETNPSSNWVKTDFLLDSNVVEFYGDSRNEGYRFRKDPDKNKYTQIISTSANPHLPEGYEEEQTKGKSPAYVAQFFKGSFNFGTNLVFPNFGTTIVEPKPLPRVFDEQGRRVLYFLIGWDYGINDPTHVIFAAFSTETRKLYIFGEMRKDNSDVKTLARHYRTTYRSNGTDLNGLMMMPRFDGRSLNKRESDLRTLKDMFEDEGLYFEPSFASHEARIIKMNALINHNQLETYSTCEFFIEEMLNYSWKLDKNGEPTNTPKDGNDHGITAAEFIVVELPTNLQELNLRAYLPQGTKHIHDKLKAVEKEKPKIYNPLEDNSYERRSNAQYGNNLIVDNQPAVVSRVRSIYDEGEADDPDRDDFPRELSAYIPN